MSATLRVFRVAASISMLVIGASPAAAHPFHTTVAEAKVDRKSGRLQVALRLFPGDLEQALSLRTSRTIDLEATKGVDELIVRYLEEVFLVRPAPPKDKVGEVFWVGKEVSVQTAWLYFEVALPASLGRLEISNRIFFEVQKRQINTLSIKGDELKASMQFTLESPSQIIDIPLRVR